MTSNISGVFSSLANTINATTQENLTAINNSCGTLGEWGSQVKAHIGTPSNWPTPVLAGAAVAGLATAALAAYMTQSKLQSTNSDTLASRLSNPSDAPTSSEASEPDSTTRKATEQVPPSSEIRQQHVHFSETVELIQDDFSDISMPELEHGPGLEHNGDAACNDEANSQKESSTKKSENQHDKPQSCSQAIKAPISAVTGVLQKNQQKGIQVREESAKNRQLIAEANASRLEANKAKIAKIKGHRL